MEDQNIDDIIPLIKLTKDLPVDVRFIEEMPFNGGTHSLSLKWNFVQILNHIQSSFSRNSQDRRSQKFYIMQLQHSGFQRKYWNYYALYPFILRNVQPSSLNTQRSFENLSV